MTSKVDRFQDSIRRTRRRTYLEIAENLRRNEPELLAAVEAAFTAGEIPMAAVHRALSDVDVEIGYSSLVRWRDHHVRS